MKPRPLREVVTLVEFELRVRDAKIAVLRRALLDFHEFVIRNLDIGEPHSKIEDYLAWSPEQIADLRKAMKP